MNSLAGALIRPAADTLVFTDDVETRLFLFGPQNVHMMVLKAILNSSLILHFHVAALMARNLVNSFFICPNSTRNAVCPLIG